MHIAVFPPENNWPLLIHPNTVVAGEIAFQRFQPITGWFTQIDQTIGSIEHVEFTKSHASDCRRKSPDTVSISSMKEIGGGVIAKRYYHLTFAGIISYSYLPCNRARGHVW